MENYIRIYDDVLSSDYCDNLVSKFEDNTRHHLTQDRKNLSRGWRMSLTQIELTHWEEWGNHVKHLLTVSQKYIDKYYIDCDINNRQWPTYQDKPLSYEPMRMKRYQPDDIDEFQAHVDNTNLQDCKRYLVMFLYLSDNDKGETVFPKHNISVPCKKGSMLLFPPSWTYEHAGKKPINTPKYIIGSYLQYE
jgi:hypothetical protein